MLEIDGAHGEGGGQLLRMAVALSATQSVPVRVVRIRAGRPTPGLAPQHVAALGAVAALCNGEVDGLAVGSKEIAFRPGGIAGGRHTFDVGTARSEEHTSELQSLAYLVCRLLLEKKKKNKK